MQLPVNPEVDRHQQNDSNDLRIRNTRGAERVEISIKNVREAKGKSNVGLDAQKTPRTPIPEFEQQQPEYTPGQRDIVRVELIPDQPAREQRPGPGIRLRDAFIANNLRDLGDPVQEIEQTGGEAYAG